MSYLASRASNDFIIPRDGSPQELRKTAAALILAHRPEKGNIMKLRTCQDPMAHTQEDPRSLKALCRFRKVVPAGEVG